LDERQWDSLLKNTGFSGVDVFVPDYAHGKAQQYGVMMSSAACSSPPIHDVEVEIIYANELSGAMATLPTLLSETVGTNSCKIATLKTSNPSGCVSS
jgi:hypothetical protein